MNFAEHTVDVHKQDDRETVVPVNIKQKVLHWENLWSVVFWCS